MASTDTVALEQWRSQTGFVLAALGAAVGLGNVWRFSYVAGENGGGAFILVYVALVLLVGYPLLLAEFAIGRSAQSESASAYATLAPGSRWRGIGVLGVLAALAILFYYPVVAGWALKYLALFAFDPAEAMRPGVASSRFQSFIAGPLQPLLWMGAVLAMTVAIVWMGIERGIERASAVLMPALAVILLLLAGYGLSLDGAGKALEFLFRPDWEALARPRLYLAALGQAFFSIGLAMGVMVTYASYLPRDRALPGAALAVVAGDTLFAIVAGLVVFPAVFTFGGDPAQGPVLAFVTLPQVFVHMPGGAIFALGFFALLVIAAVTSLVSLLEVPVAWLMRRWRWRRGQASITVGAIAFVAGMPASLGHGLWRDVRIAGLPILEAMDHVASNLLLPVGGILIALFVGWSWQRGEALAGSGLRPAALAVAWRLALRYAVPAMLALVLVAGIRA